MAEISLFYDGVLTEDGTWDREYSSSDWALFFSNIYSNGVMMTVGNALRVTASESPGMRVVIKDGASNIKGYQYINTSDYAIPIDVASATQDRIDSIVVRHDLSTRQSYVAYKKGNTTVERTEDIYELQLATINVPRNSIAITADLINDKRPDNAVCGYSSPYEPVLVSGLEAAYENMLQKAFDEFILIADSKTDEMNQSITDMTVIFDNWLKNLRDQLSKDQATNLQNQINKLTSNNELVTIEHGLQGFPMVTGLYWEYGAGLVGAETEPTGAGGSFVETLTLQIEYTSRNKLTVKVPADFVMVNPSITKLANNRFRLISGYKAIELKLEV